MYTYINTHTAHHTHTSLSPDEGLHDLGVGSLVELQFLVVEGLDICSAVLGTLPQEGGVQCQVTLGEGLQSVDMLYSNATNIGPLPIVKAHQSQHNKSTPSKSPAYRGHFGVFHKLCKVEECRCDLRDVGDRERQLQIDHQVLLLSCPQLHPAGDKGHIQQLTAGEEWRQTTHTIEWVDWKPNMYNSHNVLLGECMALWGEPESSHIHVTECA